MIWSGQAPCPEAHGRYAEVPTIFLDQDVGCKLGCTEETVQAAVDPAILIDTIVFGGVGVLPSRIELDELALVGCVTVNLVGAQKDKGALAAVLPCCL